MIPLLLYINIIVISKVLSIFLMRYLFRFFFSWPYLQHMEVPRLRVESELQLRPVAQPWKHWIPAAPVTYVLMFIWGICFWLLSFYIWIKVLNEICIYKYILPACSLSFILQTVYFAKQKFIFFNLKKSKLLFYSSMDSAFDVAFYS